MIQGQLTARGIRDERVLRAMARVPREAFVPESMRGEAYLDRPLPIGGGQTISQPYMVALMLEALQCEPGDTALEVGAGSGYQAALLAELCERVYAVEIVEELATRAEQTLQGLDYENVEIVIGDGTQGLPEHAPYDRIIVAAAAPQVPEPLAEQLADGGRLVIPVGSRTSQRLRVLERSGDKMVERDSTPCVFVPLVGRHGWRPS